MSPECSTFLKGRQSLPPDSRREYHHLRWCHDAISHGFLNIAGVVAHVIGGASVKDLIIPGRQFSDDRTHRRGYHFIPVRRGLIKNAVQVIEDHVRDLQGAITCRQAMLIVGLLLKTNFLAAMILPGS